MWRDAIQSGTVGDTHWTVPARRWNDESSLTLPFNLNGESCLLKVTETTTWGVIIKSRIKVVEQARSIDLGRSRMCARLPRNRTADAFATKWQCCCVQNSSMAVQALVHRESFSSILLIEHWFQRTVHSVEVYFKRLLWNLFTSNWKSRWVSSCLRFLFSYSNIWWIAKVTRVLLKFFVDFFLLDEMWGFSKPVSPSSTCFRVPLWHFSSHVIAVQFFETCLV